MKYTILIVDDNPDNLNILFTHLEKYFIVFAVDKGELVEEMAENMKPDLIILDIMMPNMTGFEVCENLKMNKKTADIPVIFMSALTETIDIVKGFQVGGVDYITKPYQRDVVLKRISTHIELNKSKKEIENFNKVLIEKVDEKTRALQEKIEEAERMNLILKENEDKYHKLFTAAPEGILILNVATGEVVDANSSALELFNCSMDDILFKTQDLLFTKNTRDAKEITDVLSEKDSDRKIFQNKIVRKSGEELDVELTSRVILMEGEICQQVVLRDITQQKKYEAGLKEAKEKADELNKLKSVFLANMAHELRTPLIGILGYSQILQEELEDETQQIMASGINSTGDRLLKTLNLLIDISMLGEKNHTFKTAPMNITDTLDEACLKYLPKAENKGLKFEKEYCCRNVLINADERMVYSIFGNILSNSVKFTNQGGIKVSTEIEKNGNKKFLKTTIKDTGIGISKEKINLMFEEFRQESEGINRDYQGIGLGLTLSKKFVEFNNGIIELESEKDFGTEVSIKFEIMENKG